MKPTPSFNINTEAQKNLLKYAAGRENLEKLREKDDQDMRDELGGEGEMGCGDEESVVGRIPIDRFKQNAIHMMDGRMVKQGKQEEAKSTLLDSDIKFSESVRLPNKATPPGFESVSSASAREGFQSPTRILMGNAQPELDNFRTASETEYMEYEGEMLRKTPEGKFKKYWFCLLSKELYCYRKKDDEKHKNMHNLIGCFISSEPDEVINHHNKQITFYPFKLIFPPTKVRVYYLMTQTQRDKWAEVIKEAIGYANIEDYYEVQKTLGKGKFGQVKLAIHKKTGK